MAPKMDRRIDEQASPFATFSEHRFLDPFIYAPRIPADLLTRSVWLRSATKLSRRPCLVSTRCRSLGPKGTPGTPPPPQENPPGTPPGPGEGEGGQGAKGTGGHWEGWANGALWGYSGAIPNGKLFRSQSEWKGRSEWMALPNGKLCHAFMQPLNDTLRGF